MKKYILNLLTCGLYAQVNELKEELKNIPKGIDENSVTDLIQDHHNDYVDGIYLKDGDFQPSDYDLVKEDDYNFDEFITADDISDNIDVDSIAEEVKSAYNFVDEDTVKDVIEEVKDDIKDMIDEIEKPQQISINDVIEQLVNQTETYKGMHLKYEVEITEYKRKIAELESK